MQGGNAIIFHGQERDFIKIDYSDNSILYHETLKFAINLSV